MTKAKSEVNVYLEHEFVNRGEETPDLESVLRPFVRQPFGYDVDEASQVSGLDCSVLPSRTKQEFAEEVDINTIVRRFGITGEVPQGVSQVMDGDFLAVTDFQGAMDMIVRAREMFDAMPADVRAEFHNDPAEFLEFTSKDENKARAIELGLVRPEVVEAALAEAKAAKAKELSAAVEAEIARRGAASGPVST